MELTNATHDRKGREGGNKKRLKESNRGSTEIAAHGMRPDESSLPALPRDLPRDTQD